MGATFVRFENGVRLTVKPTAFRDDEVLVRVNVGDGMLGFRSDRQTSTWASGAFVEGGLKKIEAEDVERALTSKVVGVRFGVGEDSFQFSGGTRPEDLPTQLQLLTAYLTEPGWRAAAFERIKTSGKTIHDQYESTDSGVLGRDLSGLLHGGDRRWTFPSREEIAGGRLEDLVAQLTPGLAGPVEVVIVGDVVVADAIKAVAATLGALPARAPPKTVPEAARKVGFPAPRAEPLVLTHKGRADQAVGYMAWPTTDFWSDPKRARDNAILGEVLRLRLLDELREVQGATYSPSVSFTHSQIWTGWGYIAASVEVPPEKLPPFFSDVAKIAADLRAKEPSPDEMERAKKPVLESLQRSRVTNQFWLSELSGAQTDPRRLEFVRNIQTWTEKVTAADVRRAAQTYLVPEKAWKLVVSPQAGAAQRPGDSAAR